MARASGNNSPAKEVIRPLTHGRPRAAPATPITLINSCLVSRIRSDDEPSRVEERGATPPRNGRRAVGLLVRSLEAESAVRAGRGGTVGCRVSDVRLWCGAN